MSITAAATAFFSSYVFIGLRCLQQLNAVHDNKALIMPTSLVMAFTEVIVITNIVTSGSIWIALPIGLGAGFGSLTSMRIHALIRAKVTKA